jgi:hypothetical protein
MAKRWEAPHILAVDGLTKALGDCITGSTDGVITGGDYCGCHNGENTLSPSPPVSSAGMCNVTSPTYTHGCSSGGTPSTCFCGTAATLPN